MQIKLSFKFTTKVCSISGEPWVVIKLLKCIRAFVLTTSDFTAALAVISADQYAEHPDKDNCDANWRQLNDRQRQHSVTPTAPLTATIDANQRNTKSRRESRQTPVASATSDAARAPVPATL